MKTGFVSLVGAGPGDPGLITVKGLECVRTADVVVYDRLVDRRILDHARCGAEMIDVGKVPHQIVVAQRLGKIVASNIGFSARPQSWAHQTLGTVMRPVSWSTTTSTTCAVKE